jgi:hypothetical protein
MIALAGLTLVSSKVLLCFQDFDSVAFFAGSGFRWYPSGPTKI